MARSTNLNDGSPAPPHHFGVASPCGKYTRMTRSKLTPPVPKPWPSYIKKQARKFATGMFDHDDAEQPHWKSSSRLAIAMIRPGGRSSTT